MGSMHNILSSPVWVLHVYLAMLRREACLAYIESFQLISNSLQDLKSKKRICMSLQGWQKRDRRNARTLSKASWTIDPHFCWKQLLAIFRAARWAWLELMHKWVDPSVFVFVFSSIWFHILLLGISACYAPTWHQNVLQSAVHPVRYKMPCAILE